jgi:hypothetical protein
MNRSKFLITVCSCFICFSFIEKQATLKNENHCCIFYDSGHSLYDVNFNHQVSNEDHVDINDSKTFL